jgi:orotidine-5'-phosphate decarboxylase
MTESNKLIVALDVDNATKARQLVNWLRGRVGMFKIGMQLFTAAGPDFVREVIKNGERVFLDLKYHDIPNTVACAAVEATRLGVSMFNIHASGGGEMMQRTADAVARCAEIEGIPRPNVLAVTLLTSSNAETLQQLGNTFAPAELVTRLASLAKANGMDGVVASAQEIAAIRSVVRKPGFLIVTPGMRPFGANNFDQKRITGPREAILAGADYIVVGRPVLEAADPVIAVNEILAQIGPRTSSSASI